MLAWDADESWELTYMSPARIRSGSLPSGSGVSPAVNVFVQSQAII